MKEHVAPAVVSPDDTPVTAKLTVLDSPVARFGDNVTPMPPSQAKDTSPAASMDSNRAELSNTKRSSSPTLRFFEKVTSAAATGFVPLAAPSIEYGASLVAEAVIFAADA